MIALTTCDKAAPAALTPIAAESFQPTAFSVAVHGHGRPVILIPGLGCPGAVWDETVAHLDGYETHVLTLAGFAGQPRIDAPLLATARDELVHYIRDRRLDSPIVIGHSLGGFLAYWLAASEPELVGPTVIVESAAAFGTDDRDANAAAAAEARDSWKLASDAEAAQRVRDVFGSMAERPERIAPLLARIAKSDHRAMGDAVYELLTTDVRPKLAQIRAPVLLVLGDATVTDSYRRQVQAVPDHSVVVVANTGHFVMLDDPRGFFAAIDGFLSSHPSTPAWQARK